MEEVVERAQRGDPEAFAEIVAPEFDDLLRLATAIVLDREVAADIVQDSLLAAWRGLRQLRDMSMFRTWLRRIVINRSRTALRRPRVAHLDRIRDATGDERDQNDRVSLELAMRALRPEQRACVALYYLEGMPISEIGVVLGVPSGTVKSRLHAARNRLREALQ